MADDGGPIVPQGQTGRSWRDWPCASSHPDCICTRFLRWLGRSCRRDRRCRRTPCPPPHRHRRPGWCPQFRPSREPRCHGSRRRPALHQSPAERSSWSIPRSGSGRRPPHGQRCRQLRRRQLGQRRRCHCSSSLHRPAFRPSLSCYSSLTPRLSRTLRPCHRRRSRRRRTPCRCRCPWPSNRAGRTPRSPGCEPRTCPCRPRCSRSARST